MDAKEQVRYEKMVEEKFVCEMGGVRSKKGSITTIDINKIS
jgi:hypothetical protein